MDKDNRKKVEKDVTNHVANQIGNKVFFNVQQGTDETIKGMDLFKCIASEKKNVDFDKSKGNLFEFIESAKFNRNAANSGKTVRAIVTHADGRPHDPVDIEIIDNGQVIDRVQAKVSDLKKGEEATAAGLANMQRNSKYKGQQRLVPKDKFDKTKDLTQKRSESQSIYADDYKDSYSNMTGELTDRRDGTNSGGTDIEELRKASNNPNKYARDFEMKQYTKEVCSTSANMAASNMVMTGIIKTTSNLFEVFQNRKELDKALKEVGVEVVKSGARGGATGFLSSILRIGGRKAAIPVISDASAATTIAGGFIDCGVSVYAYAQGEISAEELKESLQNTAIKSVATIYFTKSVELVFGAANPFLPMAIYTAASYVVTSTREIIKNAKLNSEEYNRIAALYEESTKQIIEYRKMIEGQLTQYIQSEKEMLKSFIDTYEYNVSTGENYDKAIYAIINFSNLYGLALKNADFKDFKTAMMSNDEFVL